MKKQLLLAGVAVVLVLGASAAMVQTWPTSNAAAVAPPWTNGGPPRITDIELTTPLPATPKVSRPQFAEAKDNNKGGGLKSKAGWLGAGLLAGHFIGPAGSAGVGAAKYREDLKAGGRRRFGAIGKIGVPVALSVLAGPVGTAGYAGFQHRSWIKKHVLRIGKDDKDEDKKDKGGDKKKGDKTRDHKKKDDNKKDRDKR